MVDETDPRILATSARQEYEVGDFELGNTYLNRLIGDGDQPSQLPLMTNVAATGVIPTANRITRNSFQLDFVELATQFILSAPYASPLFRCSATIGLGLLASQRSDARLAAEQYPAMQPYRKTINAFGPSCDRVQGLLTHFEEGLAFCRGAGFRPELAWTCCDYADCLLQRNEPGDREKATSLLDESLAISRELGMRPLMEPVLSRREILNA